MDPISQSVVGAAFAQSKANKKNIIKIGIIGFLAGLAPELPEPGAPRPLLHQAQARDRAPREA